MSRKHPPASDPEVTIRTFANGAMAPRLWRAVEEIFFRSAARPDFDSEQDKRDFLARWTGFYRECEPEGVFLAMTANGRVAGYLTGCADSSAAARLFRDIPYYGLFEDCFETYPAHFHVNCHPDFRNQGIGTRLVEAYLAHCARAGLPGVHVVTAPESRNVAFYRRCGMDFAVQRGWEGQQLLFLGTRLGARRLPKPSVGDRRSP